MRRTAILATACVVFLSALGRLSASPIVYQASPLLDGVTQYGSVSSSGQPTNPQTAQFWTFYGDFGDLVTIEAVRLEDDFDPIMWVFEGVFVDTSAFSGGSSSGFDTSDPGFLARADDEIPHPGPHGDPRAVITLTLPGTSQYTVAVNNWDSDSNDGGDGLFNYQITATNTVNPIPEPYSLVIWGGMGGLFLVATAIRRRCRKHH